MPPRSSSSRKKSNKQSKKPKHFTTPSTHPNHHSSPALQSQGEPDLRILRDQNGRNGNYPLRPNSKKCQCLVVEEKKKGFSVSTDHNEMEGSVQETQKVEESLGEDKQVVDVVDEEKVKSIAESTGEFAAQTQEGEQDSNILTQKEGESSSLFDSEKIEEAKEATEAFIEEIKELRDAESKLKEIQGKDSQETEPSSALETETSREAEAGEATEAKEEDKLSCSEEKKEEPSSIETNDALNISETSVPETDVLVSRAIEESTIVKPQETEEEKVEESKVVKEPSKEEEAKESLPPSTYVTAAETTSSTGKDKTEIPIDTESQQTNVPPAPPREHTSWTSCCGIFDFLFR